jgi:mono/diheme cytochrome c family protein
MLVDEKQKAENIAAIITYVRKIWGNNASPVTPEEVAAVRDQIKSRTTFYSPEELKAAPEK